MRLVLAGVSDHLSSTLRSPRRELDRTSSAIETIRTLQRCRHRDSWSFPRCSPVPGDVLAAVEADFRLAALVPVVVVGDRTTLAVALRCRGVAVLGIRGAGSRLRKLLASR